MSAALVKSKCVDGPCDGMEVKAAEETVIIRIGLQVPSGSAAIYERYSRTRWHWVETVIGADSRTIHARSNGSTLGKEAL